MAHNPVCLLFHRTNDHTLRQYGENRIVNDLIESKIQKQIVLAWGLTTIQINWKLKLKQLQVKTYFFNSILA